MLLAPGDAHELLGGRVRGDRRAGARPAGAPFRLREGRVDPLRSHRRRRRPVPRAAAATGRCGREPAGAAADRTSRSPTSSRRSHAPRCAAGVPLVSLDHQHVLIVSDLSDLPSPLRETARIGSLPVNLWCHGQAATIVSSFYTPAAPSRPSRRAAGRRAAPARDRPHARRGRLPPGRVLSAHGGPACRRGPPRDRRPGPDLRPRRPPGPRQPRVQGGERARVHRGPRRARGRSSRAPATRWSARPCTSASRCSGSPSP